MSATSTNSDGSIEVNNPPYANKVILCQLAIALEYLMHSQYVAQSLHGIQQGILTKYSRNPNSQHNRKSNPT